jgi:alkanesulfonate monooxygenase SsuD/methylene tetrahydromethanopterin reductase-like flavin-dependent oxidoreductase (luciferase family)
MLARHWFGLAQQAKEILMKVGLFINT